MDLLGADGLDQRGGPKLPSMRGGTRPPVAIGRDVFPKRFSTPREPCGVTRGPSAKRTGRLRKAAQQHPTLLSLKADLPRLAEEGTHDPGLYLDVSPVPGMVVNAELRVSVARLLSVDESGARTMVGQVQATRELDHPMASWELSFYLHVPEYYSTHRIQDQDAWWLRVLEQHYRHGGDEVALEPQVPA